MEGRTVREAPRARARKLVAHNPAVTGAAFHKGESKQDYATPREFIRAVELKFGKIDWDLAASESNAVCFDWIGEQQDSFTVDWHKLKPPEIPGLERKGRPHLWLNPPFNNIEPWVRKCAIEWVQGAEISFLVPAAVGSEWYAKYVHHKARVYSVRPRLCFDGKNPYPKDVVLCRYSAIGSPSFKLWKWK